MNISEPDQLKEVFTAPPDVLRPGQGARILEPIVGSNSVLLLDEGAHMSQRKLMLPAFHGQKMAALNDLMAEVTQREVASWPGDQPIDLHPRMQRLTLEVILRAAFGLDPGPRLDALRDALAQMLEFGDQPMSLVPLPSEGPVAGALSKLPALNRFQRLQAAADALIFEQLAERRAEGGEDRDDVLAMLLAARHEDGSPMADQEIRDELMTLLVAGHETTASSLAWAFSILPRTPAVLATLTDEVRSGDGDDYVTATIHETLRARPVLPNSQPRYTAKRSPSAASTTPRACAWCPTPTWCTTTATCTATRMSSGPSGSWTRGPGPTPGSRSGAAAAAASGPASRWPR